LTIFASSGTYICTGTPIDATHVVTAAHCIDINDDGTPDINGVTFNLHLDTDAGGDQVDVAIAATSWVSHPDYTGFGSPSVNDDVAVITLGAALPAGVPTYSLATSNMAAGSTRLYMVGYGQSGDGVKGLLRERQLHCETRGREYRRRVLRPR
jgi:secreted trypsin-like serine protease